MSSKDVALDGGNESFTITIKLNIAMTYVHIDHFVSEQGFPNLS